MKKLKKKVQIDIDGCRAPYRRHPHHTLLGCERHRLPDVAAARRHLALELAREILMNHSYICVDSYTCVAVCVSCQKTLPSTKQERPIKTAVKET